MTALKEKTKVNRGAQTKKAGMRASYAKECEARYETTKKQRKKLSDEELKAKLQFDPLNQLACGLRTLAKGLRNVVFYNALKELVRLELHLGDDAGLSAQLPKVTKGTLCDQMPHCYALLVCGSSEREIAEGLAALFPGNVSFNAAVQKYRTGLKSRPDATFRLALRLPLKWRRKVLAEERLRLGIEQDQEIPLLRAHKILTAMLVKHHGGERAYAELLTRETTSINAELSQPSNRSIRSLSIEQVLSEFPTLRSR